MWIQPIEASVISLPLPPTAPQHLPSPNSVQQPWSKYRPAILAPPWFERGGAKLKVPALFVCFQLIHSIFAGPCLVTPAREARTNVWLPFSETSPPAVAARDTYPREKINALTSFLHCRKWLHHSNQRFSLAWYGVSMAQTGWHESSVCRLMTETGKTPARVNGMLVLSLVSWFGESAIDQQLSYFFGEGPNFSCQASPQSTIENYSSLWNPSYPAVDEILSWTEWCPYYM